MVASFGPKSLGWRFFRFGGGKWTEPAEFAEHSKAAWARTLEPKRAWLQRAAVQRSPAQSGCVIVRLVQSRAARGRVADVCPRIENFVIYPALLLCATVSGVAVGQPGEAPANPAPADSADGSPPAAPPKRVAPGPGGDESAANVTPPQLRLFVEARWPEGEPMSRAEPVAVLFALTIGVDGKVSDAEVKDSAGAPFDSAAKQAVLGFVFEPARRNGEAISVKIAYRYEFLPPQREDPPPVEGAPEQGAEENGSNSEPSILQPSGVELNSRSPDEADNPRSPIPMDATAAVDLPAPELSFGATVEIDAPPREVTKRTVAEEHLMKIPGTGGDALRAIEVMPGVARTGIDEGDPILRGAAWNESRAFIQGVGAPMLYHFGGAKSAFNSHLLKRVDLYPGNFSARFGRATGGIIEAGVRDPKRDALHGVVELSVLDSMALVETPVGESAAVAFAGRRSNLDFFFDQFVPEDAYNVVAAPLYWDYQALGVVELDDDNTLRLLGYGSRDTIKLLFSDPSEFDPALRGSVDFAIAYHRAQASLDSRLGRSVSQKLQLTYGRTKMRQMLGPLQTATTVQEVYARAEWSAEASDALRLSWGVDVETDFIKGYYFGPQPPQAEGSGNDGGLSSESLSVVDTGDGYGLGSVRPAGYVEAEWRPAERLLLVPGVRADYYGDAKAWTVDPRLSARLEVTDQTTLKWGAGIYSQNAQYYELMKEFGNPELRPYHAVHLGLGVEQRPTDELELGVDGFYKYLYGRVVATPGGAPPSFLNDGTGRIYGGEFFARYSGSRTTAWISYTLSRSERSDRGEAWRLFEQDQTHVLALTATTKLGRGWEVGARFRLSSGNPYTPIVGAVYDANLDVYRPVDGEPFSARESTFHQLDVRIEKEWLFSAWKFATFLDLQNAYNAKNTLGEDYSYDFSQSERVEGLPVIPNLGIRGEL